MDSEEKKRFSLKARGRSFVYAIRGIGIFISTQHNAWIHTIAMIVVIIGGICFDISPAEWILIIFATGFVMTAEIFNTAVEYLVDLVSPEFNKKAARIKDLLAGGVMISAIIAAIIGVIIFLPRILEYFNISIKPG